MTIGDFDDFNISINDMIKLFNALSKELIVLKLEFDIISI